MLLSDLPDLGEKAPTNVEISNLTSTGFLVTWHAPNNTDGLSNYTIIVRPGDSDGRNDLLFNINASASAMNVYNLSSNTLYQVLVQANYFSKASVQSSRRFNQTLQGGTCVADCID